MTKLKEILKQYSELEAELTRLEKMITQLNKDRREIIKEGDPDKPALVNMLSGINARRDLAAVRIEQYRVQLQKLEPELIREFDTQAPLLVKRVKAFREEAENHLVESMLPWWSEGDQGRKEVRRALNGVFVPNLDKLKKLLPSHTFYQPENGPFLKQVMAFVAHAERVAEILDSK
jgi:hypothetical protein